MSPPFSLFFDHEFQYRSIPGLDPALFFPALPVGVIGPGGAEDLLPIIDTGAAYSLFNGKRAPSIGLELMAGKQVMLGGLSGFVAAWILRRLGRPKTDWFCQMEP